MIITTKKFLTGGSASTPMRALMRTEATGFRSEILCFLDDMIMILPYLESSKEADKILNHIMKHHKVDAMPQAPESWEQSEIAPFRLYGLFKRCLGEPKKASWLCSKIKVDDRIIVIGESHESGDSK